MSCAPYRPRNRRTYSKPRSSNFATRDNSKIANNLAACTYTRCNPSSRQAIQLRLAMRSPSSVRRRIDSRETNLVVAAARAFLSEGRDGSFQVALTQPVDWGAVEHSADHHSVTPLVAYTLKHHGGSLVPREVLEGLQRRFVQTARNNLVRLQEWRRILQGFEAANISVISFKGPPLALQAYGDVALREFVDLDLLIQPGDVLRTRDLLIREGYRLRSPQRGDADEALLRSGNRQLDFANDERGIFIDLHWGALHEMFSFQLPIDQLFRSARVEDNGGGPFLALSPEHLLLYLCAHGTKHCWLNLRWLCDVACYMKTAQELDWGLCIRLAKAANCDLVLKHTLLLAHQVLGSELPPEVGIYCEDEKARELADTAMSFLFRTDVDLGYGEALGYHLAFARGWRDRAHLVFERLFVPDEQDWHEVRLPQPLHFLYYTVRPLRFLRGRLRSNTAFSN